VHDWWSPQIPALSLIINQTHPTVSASCKGNRVSHNLINSEGQNRLFRTLFSFSFSFTFFFLLHFVALVSLTDTLSLFCSFLLEYNKSTREARKSFYSGEKIWMVKLEGFPGSRGRISVQFTERERNNNTRYCCCCWFSNRLERPR